MASYISAGQTYASCFLPPLSLAVLVLSLFEPRAHFAGSRERRA